MWSSDTILRGKIWPTEGPPYTKTEGDWRHIDILKRVNLNMIGAGGPEGLPNEDAKLKQQWLARRDHERDRLYYMLVAALKFTKTDNPEQKACQFIASLADMVDRDHDETYYEAPDSSGKWALGVEKFPVLNEVVFFSDKDANTPNYALNRFRIELYNPCENIPWIPDADEGFPVDEYFIKINEHVYSLQDLTRYTDSPNTVHPSPSRGIGADGMYAYPNDGTKRTWDRFWHMGWEDGWPEGLTREELEAGVVVGLWKPFDLAIAGSIPLNAGRVEDIRGKRSFCVDRTPLLKLVKKYSADSGPGGSESTYLGMYRRWDPLNAKIYTYKGPSPPRTVTLGLDDQCNLLWCPGWNLSNGATLGAPNTNYPVDMAQYPRRRWTGQRQEHGEGYGYERRFERNLKIVDGDLPSVGWLGELIMWSPVSGKPLTWVSNKAQCPRQPDRWDRYEFSKTTQFDTKAKFDLFRPFFNYPKYEPTGADLKPINLHVLDIFTVWDPSNDGVDNDGDGATDDDDTGRQPGDRGGAEVRVFGKLDANLIPHGVMYMAWPDGLRLRQARRVMTPLGNLTETGRSGQRINNYYGPWGPFETIGDFIRADRISPFPASMLSGSTWYEGWPDTRLRFSEYGLIEDDRHWYTHQDDPLWGDDDGDGITDERDERDMLFTWIANYFTTRANVFECDLSVQTSALPIYPEYDGERRKLPFASHKVNERTIRSTKQVLAILDRSTCLRISDDGTCDFSGPVEARMVRVTDDLRTW
jgi:hypothetical protein